MTWTAPTPAEFKIRFPQFASVDDATVQMILDEAVAEVGETWIEAYRTPGVLYLAAHLLASQGLGYSAGGGGAAVTGAVKRRKVGDVETEFAGVAGGSSGDLSGYGTTVFGQQFLRLQRKNFPAVAVVV
ncbi:virion structural protein [Rhizobium phage RHEph06]|uniref:Putative structural protein n=4 Tax=Kleczkowskavirus RHEph4 TaxID=1921526 RepID=A0A7S5R4A0_9CAUD|nr:virion structural protein [Rhizobium phage RHEph06]YP_009598462.1 virion structural protein [Rhizobium phage RHEph04]AGC35782.1 putative structural protein [Rhizobium phage RHEph05]QIG67645.1 putative structural protein [Rhizobium phage RHph_Y17]QIG68964.1 putative structural protein [Rhizobium phage RHph_Y3_43]QIG69513.1 putative structural protein [Rhizobium phage RHph_I36]QIG75387.1 putative structural protein [Rhizobium phage RHph_Y1_1]QIG75937.1 putative structural protein [Rhizobium